MSADTLLSCLDAVKHTGSGRWIARSPAHNRALCELQIRWRPPPKKENAAGAGTEAALNRTTNSHSYISTTGTARKVAP